MQRLIAYRLATGVALLFVVSMLTFVLVALIPGDPAANILGSTGSKAQYAALDKQLGLTDPVLTQYGRWLGHAVTGNLGTSVVTPVAVTKELNQGLSVTLPLVVGAVLLGALIGIAGGVLAATRGRVVARVIDILALTGLALPTFWVALVLAEYFAVTHHWLPATGYTTFATSPVSWAKCLILPVVSLAIPGVAAVAKQTRDSVDDALSRDYVESLRADGISPRRILFRHVLRNAAIPVVAVIGGQFIGALGATVIIENIFALPGLGRTIIMATTQHDLPVITGGAVYFCVLVVLVNLLVDIAYGLLNPKAKVGA